MGVVVLLLESKRLRPDAAPFMASLQEVVDLNLRHSRLPAWGVGRPFL